MSRLNKIFIPVFFIEIIIIVLGNIFCISSFDVGSDKSYRVEAKRLMDDIKNARIDTGSSSDNSKNSITYDKTVYPHILSVSIYDSKAIADNSYIVEEANGKLYRIEYKTDISYKPIYYMNIGFALMIVLTLGIYIFVYRKIVRPFSSMEKLAEELAKGNLSKPVKEEKSKVFGRFLWSMDMLREKLEESKERELEYQKERKTLMLSLSHDIKTPLSAIELYTKALSSGLYDTEEKQKEAYAGIEKNLGELSGYIAEITAASRDDFLMLDVKDEEIYLSSALKRIREYYTEKFASLHTKFEIAESGNPLIIADENRLVEVMQNILENAIKYGDGREVSIYFSEEEDAKLIHIRNTGDSPAENEMVYLFDSFYRAANAKKKKGTGLGLYISRQLMRRMNGDIYATAGDGSFEVVVVVKKS